MNRPATTGYGPYYETYISLITEDDITAVLAAQPNELREVLAEIPDEKGEAWLRKGTANNVEISVRALAYIMAGHVEYHVRILGERYLVE